MGMCASRAGDSEAAILSCAKPRLAAVCTREVFDVSFDIAFSALLKPRTIKGIEADTKNNDYPQAWQMGQGLDKAGVGTQGLRKLKKVRYTDVSREGLPKVITYTCQESDLYYMVVHHSYSILCLHKQESTLIWGAVLWG